MRQLGSLSPLDIFRFSSNVCGLCKVLKVGVLVHWVSLTYPASDGRQEKSLGSVKVFFVRKEVQLKQLPAI